MLSNVNDLMRNILCFITNWISNCIHFTWTCLSFVLKRFSQFSRTDTKYKKEQVQRGKYLFFTSQS